MFSWYCLVSDGWLYKGCREREREKEDIKAWPATARCRDQAVRAPGLGLLGRGAQGPGTGELSTAVRASRQQARHRTWGPGLQPSQGQTGTPGGHGCGAVTPGLGRRGYSAGHRAVPAEAEPEPEPPAAGPAALDGRERNPGQHECSGDVHARGERSAAAAASHDAWGWFTTRQEPTEPTVTPVLQVGKSSPREVKTLARGS